MTNATAKKKQSTEVYGAAVDTSEISYVATMFDDVSQAKSAYKELKKLDYDGVINILDAAYVEKTKPDKIKVHDHTDWAVGDGIISGGVGGGVIGALIGLIGGAILLPAAIGALVGGILVGAYEADTNINFNDKDLKKLADSLPVGTSALVAIVEDEYVEGVEVEVGKLSHKKVHSGKVPKSTADSLAASSSK